MKPGLVLILFLIAFTSFCDTINQTFLKSAINSLEVSLTANIVNIIKFALRLILLPKVWVSFLFATVSLAVWLVVLARVDLNFAFSLDSMHYIFIAISSRIFLKEKVDARRWMGTIFIIIGIALVSLS